MDEKKSRLKTGLLGNFGLSTNTIPSKDNTNSKETAGGVSAFLKTPPRGGVTPPRTPHAAQGAGGAAEAAL